MAIVNQKSIVKTPDEWREVIENSQSKPSPFKVINGKQEFFKGWTKHLNITYKPKCPFSASPISLDPSHDSKINQNMPYLEVVKNNILIIFLHFIYFNIPQTLQVLEQDRPSDYFCEINEIRLLSGHCNLCRNKMTVWAAKLATKLGPVPEITRSLWSCLRMYNSALCKESIERKRIA